MRQAKSREVRVDIVKAFADVFFLLAREFSGVGIRGDALLTVDDSFRPEDGRFSRVHQMCKMLLLIFRIDSLKR